MYHRLVNLLTYFRWLSLDIALGGAILVGFVGNELSLEVPFVVQSATFIALWMIYTIDHLSDAHRIEVPAMPRHQFHKRHKEKFYRALMAIALLGLVNLLFLPRMVIALGSAYVVAIGMYFFSQRFLATIGLKEVFIALVYASIMFI